MIPVETLTDDEFASIQRQWDECLETMPAATPFLSHAWLHTWRRTIGRHMALRVFVVRNGGEIQAAAPLGMRRSIYYGCPTRELVWLGHQTSDRVEFLVRSGCESAARALWSHLLERKEERALIHLEEVPVGSLTDQVVCEAGDRLGREPTSVLPYLTLDDDWKVFERRLPKKFQRELRTRPKFFDSQGTWDVEIVSGRDAAAYMPAIASLARGGAKAPGGLGFFDDPENLRFMELLPLNADGGVRPVLFMLRINGTMIAYNLGFASARTFCGYSTAYDPSYAKGSPGKWLMHEVIRWSHENGIREFDFSRGASYTKSRWRPNERRNCRLVAFPRGPVPALMRFAVFRARPVLKRIRVRSKKR